MDEYLLEWETWTADAIAISRHLALELPDWLPRGEDREEWPTVAEHPVRPATRSIP